MTLLKFILFWGGLMVLAGLLGLTALAWQGSGDRCDQLLLRPLAGPAWLITTDRGLVSLLNLGGLELEQPLVWELQSNPPSAEAAATLASHCDQHWQGLGWQKPADPAGSERALLIDRGMSDIPAAHWRLVLPFWVILAAVGGTALLWWLAVGVRLLRAMRGRCTNCAFDISKSSHFCPRCRKRIPRRTWSGMKRPG